MYRFRVHMAFSRFPFEFSSLSARTKLFWSFTFQFFRHRPTINHSILPVLHITMKSSIVFAALATGATARLSGSIDIDSSKINTRTRFLSWAKLFNKEYTNAEVDAKFETFKANDAFIQDYNTKGYSATVGHNEFSDMSWDDFSKVYTGVKDADKYLGRAKNVNHALSSQAVKDATPTSVDWSKKNAVTPIKNQGQCGSCVSFFRLGL